MQKLYQKNYPAVMAYIIKNRGNKEQAEDIYHEAFLSVWRNMQLEKFSPENENAFCAYLIRVARNKWIDHLRSGNFKYTVGLPDRIEDKAPDAEDIPEYEEHIVVVKQNFRKLGESCRNILTWFYYEKKSLREIAAEMQWTEATAKSNKYRCLQKLRELIIKE